MRGVLVLIAIILIISVSAAAAQDQMTIADCKKLPDGSEVYFGPSVITAVFPNCFYIEQLDRACGMRVEYPGLDAYLWRHVLLNGIVLTNINGEKYMLPDQPEVLIESTELKPLWLRNRDLGGGNWFFKPANGSGQEGISGRWGLNNVGLLVSVCGAVVGMQTQSPSWVEISDGLGQPVKVVLPSGTVANPGWRYIAAVGVCSLEKISGVMRPVVLARNLSDVNAVVENVSAVMVARPEHPAPGQMVELDGTLSRGSIATYEWDTDYDGITFEPDLTGPKVNVSFDRFGSYTVALRVKPESSMVPDDMTTQVITVDQGNLMPVVDTGGPYYVSRPESVTLDGSDSFDPNELQGDSIVSYEWDLNGDGTYDVTGESPVVTWTQLQSLGMLNGTRDLKLRVTDSFGVSATGNTTISVFWSSDPIAGFTATPQIIAPGQTVTLDGSASFHPRPDRHIVSYQWDFESDGTYDASGASTTFTPQRFGEYMVTLRVTDNSVPAKSSSVVKYISVSVGNQPPVAVAGGPYKANYMESLELDGARSYDPDSALGDSVVHYYWDLNGDGVYGDASGANTVVPWSQLSGLGMGTRTIGLRVYDMFGVTSTASTQLSIYHNRPTANIVAQPNPVAPGYTFTLDGSGSSHDRPDRRIVSYEWDMDNDGLFDDAAGAIVTRMFKYKGTYPVSLRVTDDNVPAKTATASVTINVQYGNMPPVADAGGLYEITEGSSITLDGSGSFEPDAETGDVIVKYDWDLDGDLDYNDAAGVSPNISWYALQQMGLGLGTYTVRLRVVDAYGASATDSTTLSIYRNEPVASFNCVPPSVCGCGEAFTFDASSSYHSYPARTIVSYEWDFDSNGTYDAVGPVVSRQYAQVGTYAVKLRVTDNNIPAKTSTTTKLVTVEPRNAPQANPGGPYQINVGEQLYLNGSHSTDADIACGDSITNYAWDLNGDGVYDISTSGWSVVIGWSQLQSLLQAAGNSQFTGRFPVSLKVTDTTGRTHAGLTSLDIYLNEPVADIKTNMTSAAPGYDLLFDASKSFHGSPVHGIVRYEWDFDSDGRIEGMGQTIKHRFDQFGVYNVTLRVTDDQGKIDTAVVTIIVDQGNLPPVAHPGGPYVVSQGSELRLSASLSYEPNENAGDCIINYQWDLDADGLFDDAVGENAVVPWSVLQRLGQGDHMIRLQVMDAFGTVGESFTRLEIR